MPESLLDLLTICLLGLLYLFFFRVIRAVWAELRPPAPRAEAGPGPAPAAGTAAGGHKGRRGGPTHLVVVEPKDDRGRSWELADELTVGRAGGCAIAIDDSFVSQLHARVFRRDGRLFVEDLGSTNGTFLNRDRVAGPAAMSKGDRLRVGGTVLEVR
ncbi:MAG: FHA domain-containing protein [Acidimicrobiales bacterium]|nr:FHA domain-containing protein [Acidimicrobiales bacterium]